MAMKKAIITVGLGFGDEAKGATVDYLCRKHKADLVVRYCGGSQCGHNVELPGGLRHCFSQFGSGTLAGVNTHIGPNVIVYPEAMRNEAKHLEELGVKNPFNMVTVDPKCLVTTVYHRAVNRLREISRGGSRHGSCGHGIGEARNYWLKYGQDAVFAEDLRFTDILRQKLSLMRQRYLLDIQGFINKIPHNPDIENVFDEPVIDLAELLRCGRFQPVYGKSFPNFPKTEKMPYFNMAIFEGAQGVLLDEWNGFHPYTTWSTVTPYHAHELITEARMWSDKDQRHCIHDIEVTTVGCTRPYTTRHGAGPLPGYDRNFTEHVNDIGNPWNQWQDYFRAGWLDVPLLEYSAKVVGKIDYLAVSCLDHLQGQKIKVCKKRSQYDHDLEVSHCRMNIMEANTRRLTYSATHDSNRILEEVTFDELMGILSKVAPIGIMADGPTWEHRVSRWEK